jgi:hypothetical protein
VKEIINFKSLTDYYLKALLIKVINNLLEKYNISNRVTLIITHNIFNNNTFIKELNSYINKTINRSFLKSNITHIPYFIHIIQLALKALLSKIRFTLINKTLIIV